MEVKVITDTVALSVVGLANMRNFLEFTATDTTEDALITTLIKGAVKLCEEVTGEAFGEKTIELFVSSNELINGSFDLPYYPFGSMTSVIPIDIEGTESDALVLNTGYYLSGNQQKNIKLLTSSFLIGVDNEESFYKIRYKCGYDITDTTEVIPESYKEAIMDQVRLWYKRASDGQEYTMDLDYSIKMILNITSRLTAI